MIAAMATATWPDGRTARTNRTQACARTRLLRALAVLFLAAAAALRAQAPSPTPEPAPERAVPAGTRYLIVQNLAPFARKEGVAVVVPFAQGVAGDVPSLCVDDRATVWEPFGARWPDGSWRQALCLFQTEIGALQEQRLPLLAGDGRRIDDEAPIAMPAMQLEFVARQGDRTTRGEPVRVRDLESNALRRVELRRARLGKTGLVIEAIVTAWRDQPHAACDVAVFFSDPEQPAMQCHVDELAIECRGMALVLRHAGWLGIAQTTTPYGTRAVLLRDNVLGDGQGLRRTGAVVPPLAGDGKLGDQTLRAAAVAPLLGATPWRDSRAFGPFGVVPDPPQWLAGPRLRQHFAARHRAFVQLDQPGGDPFGVMAFGLEKMAGQTGDQEDFGVCKLSLTAWSGLPSMLLEVEASVLQEACRPVHFFEADATPVEPANHPAWVVWSGRTHWHAGVSKDRLGKPADEGRYETHGWTGKDRQHWSSNYLSAFALLSGAWWPRVELENEVRLYLAGQTIDPALTTSNAGAPRGAGRVALAAAWNLCVTADPRLRVRMNERMDVVEYPQWFGRTAPPDRVRPMSINDPDPRQLDGKHVYWNPWQDAIAAVGFAAHHRMTGNPRARELAEGLAVNVVRQGWLIDARGCEVAMSLRWFDGAPLTPEQWRTRDQSVVDWSFGTAFSEWSIGAVEIARVVAERDGDEELAKKAREIQRRYRSNRSPPPPNYPFLGGIDRFGEWDAVAWAPR